MSESNQNHDTAVLTPHSSRMNTSLCENPASGTRHSFYDDQYVPICVYPEAAHPVINKKVLQITPAHGFRSRCPAQLSYGGDSQILVGSNQTRQVCLSETSADYSRTSARLNWFMVNVWAMADSIKYGFRRWGFVVHPARIWIPIRID